MKSIWMMLMFALAAGCGTEEPSVSSTHEQPISTMGFVGGKADTFAISSGDESKAQERVAAPICGGIRGIQCGKEQYCNYALGDGCDVSDAQGRCNHMPEVCTEEYSPVCGCDGINYDNACVAAMSGVSVAYDGVCGGTNCGGLIGEQCAAGEFCDLAQGDGCYVSDARGVCTPLPELCGRPTPKARVCGCDGVTYASECEAHTNGASVLHEGECSS